MITNKKTAKLKHFKLPWHLHGFCSRNSTQCVVARRAISVVRSVAWSGVCVLFVRCTSITYAQFTTCLRILPATFAHPHALLPPRLRACVNST